MTRGLGDLEADIMRRLWDATGPVSVRDVLLSLEDDRPLAYNTVKTVMERLYAKSLLTRVESGKAYLYRPAMTRAEFTAGLMLDALDETADRTAALVHFTDRMTPEQVSILSRLLASRPQT